MDVSVAELRGQLYSGQEPAWPAYVRAYPGLLVAFLRADLATVGRVYMMARAIDDEGRGWLSEERLKLRLTHKHARSRLFSWRRLRQILAAGDGVCWTRDPFGRLFYYAPHRVANRLNCGRLRGHPVQLRVKALRESIQATKAEFYAAWHSGRRDPNPITRATIETLTGVPPSTQRLYEEIAGIEPAVNIAVGERYSQERLQDAAWRYGGAFKFVDWAGKFGPKKRAYVARMLPNSYAPCHKRAAKGRLRKVNRQIELVEQLARANGPDVYSLYFPTADAAAKAYNGDPNRDRYYLEGDGLDVTAKRPAKIATFTFWGSIAAA